ncbi:MAG: hypothetical protein Q4G67_03050 [Actinomycetia bacterium]|nr:hypothetical protein [Actinomycetes bacterium]
MRRAGAWMFFIGLPLLLIGIGLMIFGVARAAGSFDPDSLEGTAIPVSGLTPIELAAGDTRSLTATNANLDVASVCTVTGPSSEVSIDTGQVFGEPVPNLANFTATDSGEHIVACSASGINIGPEIDPATMAGAGLALLGGFLLAGLGGLLALIGGIMWLVGRSRDNNAMPYQR